MRWARFGSSIKRRNPSRPCPGRHGRHPGWRLERNPLADNAFSSSQLTGVRAQVRRRSRQSDAVDAMSFEILGRQRMWLTGSGKTAHDASLTRAVGLSCRNPTTWWNIALGAEVTGSEVVWPCRHRRKSSTRALGGRCACGHGIGAVDFRSATTCRHFRRPSVAGSTQTAETVTAPTNGLSRSCPRGNVWLWLRNWLAAQPFLRRLEAVNGRPVDVPVAAGRTHLHVIAATETADVLRARLYRRALRTRQVRRRVRCIRCGGGGRRMCPNALARNGFPQPTAKATDCNRSVRYCRVR